MNDSRLHLDSGDGVYHRRAIRHFANREVHPAMVSDLVEAAMQAPSAVNQPSWVFGVFHGHERLRSYSERAKRHLLATWPAFFDRRLRREIHENADHDLFHGANTLIVIYASHARLHSNEDCGLAAQNLMLAAYCLGLGTCPIGFARPWLDLRETKREMAIPEHCTALFPVVVGYPAGAPAATPRHGPNIASWQWDHERSPSHPMARVGA